MNDQIIPDIQLENNTEQRLPCVLVLDGSRSMDGTPIDELNKGLKVLQEELQKDEIASSRVQLLIIRIGDDDKTEVLVDWTDASKFNAPEIRANGTTPIGKGMTLALEKIEEQKGQYAARGITYNRPWLWLFTDGVPTDKWEDAAADCKQAEASDKAIVFTIGTQGADFEILKKFSTKFQPLKLNELKFSELFLWLSKSASKGSVASPEDDDNVGQQFEATGGWGQSV